MRPCWVCAPRPTAAFSGGAATTDTVADLVVPPPQWTVILKVAVLGQTPASWAFVPFTTACTEVGSAGELVTVTGPDEQFGRWTEVATPAGTLGSLPAVG